MSVIAPWLMSCFNPGSSALSHTLPRMTPVTSGHTTPPAPVHIRTSLPSQSQWYMWWFIVQFVFELLHCLSTYTGTFLQSAFMNSLVQCGHSTAGNQGLIGIVVTPWLCACTTQQEIQWSVTTSAHSTESATSPTIIATALTHRCFFCLCVTYCLYFSLFTIQ